jgi:putative hydrolase of the HAD superfamily
VAGPGDNILAGSPEAAMNIDFSLITLIPADESHREFSYYVKKEAEGGYITGVWGWDEDIQRDFHTTDWEDARPEIIQYDGKPIGTILVTEVGEYYKIRQFFILPEYQNRGIGTYILKNILDKADRSGRLTRLTCLKNSPAASLYHRHGFHTTGSDEYFNYMERKPAGNAIKSSEKKYKAVIFDLFGTIIYNFSLSAYENVLSEMADILKAPRDDFARLWFDTFRERMSGKWDTPRGSIEYICERLNVKATGAEIERTSQARLDFSRNNMIPRPEAVRVISRLKNQGYKIGLISDCSGEIPRTWPDTPFAPLFDVTIFSCEVGMKKPKPEIYLLATKQLGITPQECMYIGDGSSRELTGALRVGMYPVLIRVPGETADSHFIDREEGWDGPVIESLEEIPDLLE